jgi:hypothetical protein
MQSVRLVVQVITERSLGPFELYGVDPDYYHALVPLSGEGQRRIESFIIGLKPAGNLADRSKRWVKHLLIKLGLSARIYESFVIVLEGSLCS